jgi:hypothetical protein
VASKAGDPMLSVIRELSVNGAQLLTQMVPVVGDDIDLQLFIHIDQPDVAEHVIGRVVRVERRPPVDIWASLVAVQFATALAGLDREIAELAAHQASIFGTPTK